METMKFDNSDSNLNNEPAPKAPEGGVGDGGASGASAESAGGANAGKANQIQGEGAEKRETEKETSGPEAKTATNGTTIMSFQTSENDGKNDNNNDKRKKKLIAAGVALAVLILAVAGWQYWLYTQTPFYKQTQMVKAIDESLKESEKWGGKTPEETVSLFAEAIKKGDFELAGKYGRPELITPELEKMKADGKIDQLVKDLEVAKLKENPGFGGDSMHLIVKENSQEIWILSLYKSERGTWKIVEF